MSQLLNLISRLDGYLDDVGMPRVWNIIWALVFILAGRWLARRSRVWFRKAVSGLDMTVNESVVNLTESIIYYGILIFASFLALAALGIPIDSLLLIFILSILMVVIILQPTLSNVAATIIFIVFQTIKEGDWIEIGGTYGQVKELQMFNTVIRTIEQSIVTIPNGEILSDHLTNFSKLGYRRADMLFTISYKDDLPKAKQILHEILDAEERVLAEPQAIVGVQELGERGVQIDVWPFVDMPDFIAVKQVISEQVKLRFDEAGVTIPFPQRDLHLDGKFEGDGE